MMSKSKVSEKHVLRNSCTDLYLFEAPDSLYKFDSSRTEDIIINAFNKVIGKHVK